ncbi:MAG: HU family DNA-binding protein [Gemmataceae bacterium]
MAESKRADSKSATPQKAMPKSTVYKEIAEKAGLKPKEVAAVFEALQELIKSQLTKRNGPGEFAIPNLVKLKLIKKPATKATVRDNPFKPGEKMEVKAKPASVKVKPVVLKGLKELNK